MALVLVPEYDVSPDSHGMCGPTAFDTFFSLFGILCLQCYVFFRGSDKNTRRPIVRYSVRRSLNGSVTC